jgi:hypothetical protein
LLIEGFAIIDPSLTLVRALLDMGLCEHMARLDVRSAAFLLMGRNLDDDRLHFHSAKSLRHQ